MPSIASVYYEGYSCMQVPSIACPLARLLDVPRGGVRSGDRESSTTVDMPATSKAVSNGQSVCVPLFLSVLVNILLLSFSDNVVPNPEPASWRGISLI